MTKLNKQSNIYLLALIGCVLQAANVIFGVVQNIISIGFLNTFSILLIALNILSLIPIAFFYVSIRLSHKTAGRIMLGIYFLYLVASGFRAVLSTSINFVANAFIVAPDIYQVLTLLGNNALTVIKIVIYALIAVEIFKGALNKRMLKVCLIIDFIVLAIPQIVIIYNTVEFAFNGEAMMALINLVYLVTGVGLFLNRGAVYTLVSNNDLIASDTINPTYTQGINTEN